VDSIAHSSFHMADIRMKRPTRRRAVAVGELLAGVEAFNRIAQRQLPKGDALAMAEIAALQGAKQASALMPLCHPLPLELVRARHLLVPERHAVRLYCEVATEARSGVEMEALAGVSAALLTVYDLTKPVDPALSIQGTRLLFKEGGKKGLWIHPDGMSAEETAHYRPRADARLDEVRAAVITLSDRAHRGEAVDESGPLIVERLAAAGAKIEHVDLLPDGLEPLGTQLRRLADAGVRLCLCTGGTGFSARDLTPEALEKIADRRLTPLADMFRVESARHTPMAWLSRAEAVQIGNMLVMALPGSPKAVRQGLDILLPLLPHALAMMSGEGHP
jgi:molybdenum cofactor biosynthesis protein MoaC